MRWAEQRGFASSEAILRRGPSILQITSIPSPGRPVEGKPTGWRPVSLALLDRQGRIRGV